MMTADLDPDRALAEPLALPAGKREERREAILDAAETLFCERGFDAVTLAEVVRRAGGSMATLYALFDSKHGLVRAVMERADHSRVAALVNIIDGDLPPGARLRHLAHCLHEYLTHPRSIALMRMVIGESLRDDSFAQAFHCAVHEMLIHRLADLFQQWNASGVALFDAPQAAAELYIATVACDAHINAIFGVGRASAGTSLACQIDWKLAPFLSHFRVSE